MNEIRVMLSNDLDENETEALASQIYDFLRKSNIGRYVINMDIAFVSDVSILDPVEEQYEETEDEDDYCCEDCAEQEYPEPCRRREGWHVQYDGGWSV
jgi:hypothetical protein